jgi:hypothetical protein
LFLVAQFPYADVRGFWPQPDRTHVLPMPTWPEPRIQQEFIRSVGGVQLRRRGGSAGWAGKHAYCTADHAIRFARPLSAWPINTAAGGGHFVGEFRRMFADGRCATRIEVGVTRQNSKLRAEPSALVLLNDFLSIPVCVSSRDTRGVREVPLPDAGSSLESLLINSTTRTSPRLLRHSLINRLAHWTVNPVWLTTGAPLVVVEYARGEESLTLPSSARKVASLRVDGVSVSHLKLWDPGRLSTTSRGGVRNGRSY